MKVAFHTLGCKVNQYESEAMAEAFRREGYIVVDEREYANVYVINTCTVTAVADKKSRQYIRRMKKVNPDSIVVVTGCYAQISSDEVGAVQGVDIVAGTNEKGRLTEYVKNFAEDRIKQIHIKGYEELDVYEETGCVTSTENRTRAYIKVQEGCNRFCTYCVIPYARGKVRSRELADIVSEAEALVRAGYKEIVLTGINTALYGGEKAASPGIEEVIRAMDRIDGDFRIRLSSLEPAVVNADYVKRLFKYDKLCHHMHLSAQSGSDRVLAAMNRPYSRKQYMEIVRALRDFDPHYGISTDIIAGFPGEKEADFEESCSLVRECDFCKTHVFKYSKRPFTKAAGMEGHVAPQVKNRRSDGLQEVGKEAADKFFVRCIGEEAFVLMEDIDEEKGIITGYADNYTRVYAEYDAGFDGRQFLNRFVRVVLTGTMRDGMKGRITTLEE
ncbi:MAG: tRNA (N(6)-L-threonylcarbamoyladenosine(37)-C(2))-methylthiotransferase MtaB [Clostridiales bacterium]|nr:tRNA (N(6)-L-threonylcarbamoyladenosine(37)-C(2))-methylthiotransferase MtaB [Clostridiales bacterium]